MFLQRRARARTHARSHARARTHTRTRTHAHTRARAHARTHARTHAHIKPNRTELDRFLKVEEVKDGINDEGVDGDDNEEVNGNHKMTVVVVV